MLFIIVDTKENARHDAKRYSKNVNTVGRLRTWVKTQTVMSPVSDRVYKTVIHEDRDLKHIATLDPNADVNLKTCEVAFDRTCQLACSYCNPAFSSTWVKDIPTNGGYPRY